MEFNKRQRILRKRLEKIDKFESLLKSRVTRLERELYRLLIEKVVEKTAIDDETLIKFNTKNIDLITRARKFMRDFEEKEMQQIIATYVSQIREIQDSIDEQYGSFLKSSTRDTFIKKKNNALSKALGLVDGKVEDGGFLQEITNLGDLKGEVQRELFKAVGGQTSLEQLRNNISDIVREREPIKKRVYNQLQDTYSQIERAEATFYAESIGMTAFIFFGNVISTTRQFCRDRVGQVFLNSETLEWAGLEFQGKNSNYNPLSDLGGYNCRHSKQYLTNREALRMRSDLVVRNGILVVA